jgi:hypothetical protein
MGFDSRLLFLKFFQTFLSQPNTRFTHAPRVSGRLCLRFSKNQARGCGAIMVSLATYSSGKFFRFGSRSVFAISTILELPASSITTMFTTALLGSFEWENMVSSLFVLDILVDISKMTLDQIEYSRYWEMLIVYHKFTNSSIVGINEHFLACSCIEILAIVSEAMSQRFKNHFLGQCFRVVPFVSGYSNVSK